MNYKLIVSYNGAYFHGFQRQKNITSVQEEIEKALSSIMKQPITIHGAGRTDAGVHATGQVVSFKTNQAVPCNNLRKVMNKMLYPYIYIKSVEIVDDNFHPRIMAIKKEYHYYVSINTFDPLKADYIYFFHDRIDIPSIRKAMKYLEGTHDFKSLGKSKEYKNTIRTIESFTLDVKDGNLIFKIIGDGFLHNMVRIIISLMLRVGEGKLQVADIPQIIEGRQRKLAPWVAPASGLYLYKVYYE